MRFRDLSAFGLLLTLAAASACTETSPPSGPDTRLLRPDGPPVLAVLDCSGSAGGIECRPAALANIGRGPLFDRILGGQDVYVRLAAVEGTNSFDSEAMIVSQEVTVQNLTAFPFGTTNWMHKAELAVRVFFHSGPTHTGGTAGDVTVVNEDGTDTFTGSDQPFYEYDELLPANQPNLNSKLWSFQLPDGTTTFSFQVYVSVKMPDESAALAMAEHRFTSLAPGADSDNNCAIRADGTEYCWGYDGDGDAMLGLGDASGPNRSTPAGVLGDVTLTQLARGGNHTCGLTSSGTAYCWGRNVDGELGDGTNDQHTTPTAVSGGLSFTMIRAGDDHVCALTSSGAAYCWGSNGDGQLGDGTQTPRNAPTAVGGGRLFTSIAVGGRHSCGVTSTGAAYCWGNNGSGELGDGTNNVRTTPTAVGGGLSFVALVAGDSHTCGLISTGAAYCWGQNASGQVGDGTMDNRTMPTAVEGGLSFSSITGGGDHNCGIASGTAYCWGADFSGQVGDDTDQIDRPVPTAVSMPPGVSFGLIMAGWDHTCALTPSGAAYCWGRNQEGQVGDGTSGNDRNTPTAVLMP